MKNVKYQTLFKIGTIITSVGFFCMTMMFFVLLVYAKDELLFSVNPGLIWFSWAIPAAILYIIGIPIIVKANSMKRKEREESLRID